MNIKESINKKRKTCVTSKNFERCSENIFSWIGYTVVRLKETGKETLWHGVSAYKQYSFTYFTSTCRKDFRTKNKYFIHTISFFGSYTQIWGISIRRIKKLDTLWKCLFSVSKHRTDGLLPTILKSMTVNDGALRLTELFHRSTRNNG